MSPLLRAGPGPLSPWLVLALGWTAASGCELVDRPGQPPGLEVITTEVAGPAGSLSAVVVRVDRASRVSLVTASEAGPLAAGRAESSPTALVFAVPAWLGAGAAVELTVVAVSADGLAESARVTLRGMGPVSRVALDGGPFLEVAAAGGRAAVLSTSSVHFVSTTARLGSASPSFRPLAAAADQAAGLVLVGGASDQILVYDLSAAGALSESFRLPGYDAFPPSPVTEVRDLHVNGPLVGAATDRGMSIVDRAAGLDSAGNYCRGRSAMTTMLAATDFHEGMDGVVVTLAERIVAAGGYLNLNEPFEGGDDGTCTVPMPNRGTRVIDAPEGAAEPWAATALTLSGSTLWVGRLGRGLVGLPVDFEPLDNRRLPSAGTVRFAADELPLPAVVDLAPAGLGGVWAVLQDAAGSWGGLARVGPGGVELWVDMGSLGDLPTAVATTDRGEVWVATVGGYLVLTDLP